MKILADECCPRNVVLALRNAGHDVVYIAEDSPSAQDSDILRRALADQRIILTEDRDFCELVFLRRLPTYGIVLVRINQSNREEKIQRVHDVFENHAADLPQSMTTVTLTKVRIRSLE